MSGNPARWLRRRPRVDSLARIDTHGDWARLSARPGHHSVARTETVKFLIDLNAAGRTYFLDSKTWDVHFDFVRRFIDPFADYDRFNIQEYTRDDRRFILGSLMHYLDGGHWTIELAGADTLAAERIAWMFEHVGQRVGLPVELKFRAISPSQIDNANSLSQRIPVLSSDALNASVVYQPVVLGVAYGYIRLIRGTLDVADVRPCDIVVTEQVPEQIPPVAALVTSQIQAPLAHVAVLSRNRNTPDMALRDAVDLDSFRRHEGQLVKITVASQDYAIEPADPTQAQAAWASMRPAADFRPEADLQVGGLFDIDTLPESAARFVGAKAAQVGQLHTIDGVASASGFAIPFGAYAAHLESAGLLGEIDAMLVDAEFRRSAAVRADRLGSLRGAIVAHPVNAETLAKLLTKLRTLAPGKRSIWRSSTNAEDLDGFNGAGLYESVVLAADPSADQLADVLRAVWASVWLQRAFEERDWYRIEHRCVAMGVLVQTFVDDAVATGVAITGNPFKAGLDAVFINTQVSGASVTGALGNQLPEQYLVATWSGYYEPELLSRSTLNRGAPILAHAELNALTDQLRRIHGAMVPTAPGGANAMDVEFALTTQRRLVILQARPYTIVYSLDRARSARREVGAFERFMRRMRKVQHRIGSLLGVREGTPTQLSRLRETL